MDSELDLSEFCCLNKDCPDYGKKSKGNKALRCFIWGIKYIQYKRNNS